MRPFTSVFMVGCALLLTSARAHGAPVSRFTFGTPESVTHAGFTKVTVADAFAPQRGFGFERTEGLLAFDRGGARIERPADEYTASAYGAYRTTSELTCAFVEGTSDNAFLVALPDGNYTVWLIASDAAEAPPLFEVWANGTKKLDVRVARRAFVFMEPFQARATNGQLRIEFRGRHGWLLNALIIGQDGPELDQAVAAADRHIFFLSDEELPNWTERPATSPNPPLKLTAAEKRQGCVTFTADYTERLGPAYTPPRAAVGQPLSTFATPGEFEPATFGVLADKELGAVAVSLSDFIGEQSGQRIPRRRVQVGVVRCWPVRVTGEGPKGEYEVLPEKIEPASGRATRVAVGQRKQWWLTLQVPPNTPAGYYRARITVRPEQAPPTHLEWRLRVLPFRLTRPKDRHWGTWWESFPPVGGLRGPERRGRNTPAEVDRLARVDVADYRNHGFDLVMLNYYFGVKENPDGSFTYDLGSMPRDLEYLKALGSSAPVVICCEYAFRNLEYEMAEPGKEHVPGTFSPKARRAIVGLVRHIRDEAQRNGWPKLYFAPIDEPGNSKTANRMTFAENVLDMVHEAGGRTATTLTAADAQRLGDRVDVRIYAYGHFNREKVIRETKEGHPFWYYNNGMFYGHCTQTSRNMAGFEFLRSGATVATAWGFDSTYGNPENDFDSGHRDWNVLFPGVDRPTPTIYWEMCREGVDDCRYVATLQEAIRQARARGKRAAAQRAEKVLAPLIDPKARSVNHPLQFGRYRWRIAREILALRGDREATLPFTAVLRHTASPEKLGPNLIADPSFEAGPQADGFPTAGFQISDPYSEAQAKPVNALVVTDEIAHSGRYSLKWDLSQAEGKGFVYGRDRWLIVNVQVPPERAQALRGKRVRVGYWFRLGSGTCLPSLTLRQFGKGEFLDGLHYAGGVDDPAVWNHFVTEGRLRPDFETLDIHVPCLVPSDAELARKSVFYIDDVTLQEIEEPPLSLTTPLDEYYLGEPIAWRAEATPDPAATGSGAAASLRLALFTGGRVVARQTRALPADSLTGSFTTRALKPGVYTLQATLQRPGSTPRTARCEVLLTPDPFGGKQPSKP